MLYPLYEYYYLSDLSLDEIIDDYLTDFYHKKYGSNKSAKVRQKVLNSSKIVAMDAYSIQARAVPNYMDFGGAINETLWFMIQSNETQALGVLIAASEWNRRVNSVYHFGPEEEVRNKALKIFKKFGICGEMTRSQFEEMTDF